MSSDLTAWAEPFLDEMASPTGRAYIRDALLGDPDGSNAGQCSTYAAEQINVILSRAAERGEDTPDVETVIDAVVAPSCTASFSAPTDSTPRTRADS